MTLIIFGEEHKLFSPFLLIGPGGRLVENERIFLLHKRRGISSPTSEEGVWHMQFTLL
jgi:hypothetical protein